VLCSYCANPALVTDWTGPGVFTDCVYRYMLARYGFKPRDLIHQKNPLRVGDVLYVFVIFGKLPSSHSQLLSLFRQYSARWLILIRIPLGARG
jgi:hypothetical protein